MARLPWSLLATVPGQRVPKAGDRVTFTLQPLWGDAAGDRQVLNYNEVERAKGFHFQSAANWGVLFSTPGGNAVGRRAYLFNQDAQITQDVPSEARLQPGNWGNIGVE